MEFLAVQEWELEIAYRELLDFARQQGGAPFAWDYQEISADNSEILADESTVENLKIAIPKAEADDVEFQGAVAVGPSLQQQAEVVKLLAFTPSRITGSRAGCC